MVSWMCNLDASGDLIGRLEALADRHVDYGCRPLHCEWLARARHVIYNITVLGFFFRGVINLFVLCEWSCDL